MTTANGHSRCHSGPPQAFTLVELLVVVAIIALLIAILLPSLQKARDTAKDLTCRSNLHQLGYAFFTYATDSLGRLPMNTECNPGDWLSKGSWDSQVWGHAPQDGSIYPYVNSMKVYRCPSIAAGVPPLQGVGSNGRFDYVFFSTFNTCNLAGLKTAGKVYFTEQTSDGSASVITPLLTEEDPDNSAGGINLSNVEGTHSNVDPMGAWHMHGGNYVAVDGSTQHIVNPLYPSYKFLAKQWWSIAPSGAWQQIGPDSSKTKHNYGYWDRR